MRPQPGQPLPYFARTAASRSTFATLAIVASQASTSANSAASSSEAGPVDAADCIDLSVIDGLRELREPGEPDPVAELIDLYLADSPNRVEQMRAAAAKNDAAALKVAVHTLKGSSSNLGAKPLAKLCAEFEERVTKGNLDDAGERADAIEREFAKLRIILERERER